MSNVARVMKYGILFMFREEAERSGLMPPGLRTRMAPFTGKYIMFDPGDDAEGLCLVGDDVDQLARETLMCGFFDGEGEPGPV